MNNPCTLIKAFHYPIKLFAIQSHTKSIHEGCCDPWLAERGTISGKKSSGMKLELWSYSEKTSSSCLPETYSTIISRNQDHHQIKLHTRRQFTKILKSANTTKKTDQQIVRKTQQVSMAD